MLRLDYVYIALKLALDSLWMVFGLCSGFDENVFRLCLDCYWIVFLIMYFVLILFGLCLDQVYNVFGLSLDCV